MDSVPREIVVKVLSFLDPPILRIAQNVCRLWANISAELHEFRSISFARSISSNGNWIQLHSAGDPPFSWSHRPVSVGRRVYVICRSHGPDPMDVCRVFVLFVDTLKWECPKLHGTLPGGGSSSVGSVVYWRGQHKLVLFCQHRQVSYVHFLDLKTMSWEEAKITGYRPSARVGHRAVIDVEKNEMYVFGGISTDHMFVKKLWITGDREYFNDMLVFDLVTLKWRVFRAKNAGPSVRADVSMHEIIDKEQKLQSVIVFGGKSGMQCMIDVWLLDVPRKCWTEIITTGSQPLPSRCCGSKVIHGQFVLIDEGINECSLVSVLNLENLEWKRPLVKNLPQMKWESFVVWNECDACFLLFCVSSWDRMGDLYKLVAMSD